MSDTTGQQLQKARTERKLTLEEAAHSTHIRLHYLEALEKDQRHLLPSAVQGRGFLRLYADYLGLDAQPLLDAWDGKDRQTQAAEPPPKEPPRRRLRWRREPLVETLLPEGAPEPDESQQEEAPDESEEEPRAAVPEPEPQIAQIPEPAPEPAVTFEGIFQEVGLVLRRQREALSLKISDVERFTHIRYRYIDALEKGLIDELPSPVQGRGMLNNYARFLDLDTEKLMLRFADGLQARRLEYASTTKPGKTSAHRKRPAQPQTQPHSLRRLFTPDLMIGGAIILFLFGFAIWGASQVSAIRQEKAAISAGGATLEPVANIMLTVSLVPADAPTETPTPMPTIVDVQSGPPSAVIENPEEVPVVDDTGTGETPAAGTLESPQTGEDRLQLYIVASQRAYMRIVADQQEVFNGRVVPGNAYQFSGKDQIELLTGNAAALQVFFNQNDLGSLGSVGQVVSMIFNPQGLITPTAIFTATPSNTPQPSLTIAPTATEPPEATPTITPFIP